MFGRSKKKQREVELAAARSRQRQARESPSPFEADGELGAEARAFMAQMPPAKTSSEMTREELVAALERKNQALVKLWDAYERVEAQTKGLREQIAFLEQQLAMVEAPKTAHEVAENR